MPDNETQIIFSVSSTADIALRAYYLDDRQRQHILLGHRGLQSAIVAIQTAIESPTQIYRSKTDDSRLLFISTNVLIGKGRPMKVIVERENDQGKIITATWSGNTFTEQLIWESSGTLYTNYDKKHDVFYISKGATTVEYSEDDPEFDALWLRKNEENDSPQGVTIFGLRKIPQHNRDRLFERIAAFLGVTKDDIGLRAGIVFKG